MNNVHLSSRERGYAFERVVVARGGSPLISSHAFGIIERGYCESVAIIFLHYEKVFARDWNPTMLFNHQACSAEFIIQRCPYGCV